MRTALRRFKSDRGGVSAVEFALIAPILIVMYCGMAEGCQAMMADRRAAHVAASLGDLVAQDTVITTAEVNDVLAAGDALMAPFPAGPSRLRARLTSVVVDAGGTARVDWSDARGLAARPKGQIVTLPEDLVANGESVVMTEVQYVYESTIGGAFVLPPVLMGETYYLRPRRTDQVTRGS